MGETRKPAAILVADLVGHSRLGGGDDDRILAQLGTLRSGLTDSTAATSSRRIAMSSRRLSLISFALLAVAVLLLSISMPPPPVLAQSTCVVTPDKQNPTNRVLRCGGALTIQPAPGTVYVTGGNGPPSSVQFGSGALLIDFHGSKAQRDFQVMTPEAIASVRGTRWAMEVKSGLTSALGLAGAVRVARANNPADAVVLRQGEGVDVSPTGEALQVKRWAPQRVQALLARFGQ